MIPVNQIAPSLLSSDFARLGEQIELRNGTVGEQGNRRFLNTYAGAQTFINGAPVTQQWLRSGDTIQVGSSALQYAERAVASRRQDRCT